MIRLLVAGLGGLVVSCSAVAAGDASWLLQPADPTLGLRAPRYSNVTAGVKRFGVVEPKDWRELNRAVGPQPGSGSGHGPMPGMGMGNGRRDTGGR